MPLPHAAPPCRSEVWRNLQPPGTFRAVLRNAWLAALRRQPFAWPVPASGAQPAGAGALAPADAEDDSGWYVGAADLAAFKAVLAGVDGGAAWEPMMHKQWPGTTYTAWRRTLPSGKSEYKSVTVSGEGRTWQGRGAQRAWPAGSPSAGRVAELRQLSSAVSGA